jgi:hypothetical protein
MQENEKHLLYFRIVTRFVRINPSIMNIMDRVKRSSDNVQINCSICFRQVPKMGFKVEPSAIYLAQGATDLRKSINGLSAIVRSHFPVTLLTDLPVRE